MQTITEKTTNRHTRVEYEQDLMAGILVRSHSEQRHGRRKKRPRRMEHQPPQTAAARLLRLPGLRHDLLLPIPPGYDYLGAQIAALMVAFVGVLLILLFVL
jgi:hypothetical protein